MSSLDTQNMAEFLRLARTVKTDAGQKRFGEPIGSKIVKESEEDDKNEISPARLLSLKHQVQAAKEAGNRSQAKALLKDYRAAAQKFANANGLEATVRLLGKKK